MLFNPIINTMRQIPLQFGITGGSSSDLRIRYHRRLNLEPETKEFLKFKPEKEPIELTDEAFRY